MPTTALSKGGFIMLVPAFIFLLQNENTNYSSAGLAAFIAAYGIFVAIILVLTIVIYWRIASKAGYAGALSLLMLVPLVNLIIIILFAFTEWPIERELRALRGGARTPISTT
jgi:amino acid transporter